MIEQAWNEITAAVAGLGGNALRAALILAAGISIAFLLSQLAKAYVRHFGRSDPQSSKFLQPDQIVNFGNNLARIVFWTTIVLFGIFSLEAFDVDVVDIWLQELAVILPRLMSAAIVLAAGVLFARAARKLVTSSGESMGFKQAQQIGLATYVAGLLVAALVSIKQVGIEIEFITSIFLIIIAALLLGGAISFGFGSAPMVRNILACFYSRSMVKPGDRLRINGVEGDFVRATATAFVLQTSQGMTVIPGHQLNEAVIEVIRQ